MIISEKGGGGEGRDRKTMADLVRAVHSLNFDPVFVHSSAPFAASSLTCRSTVLSIVKFGTMGVCFRRLALHMGHVGFDFYINRERFKHIEGA